MEINILIGIIVLVLAYSILVALVLWSRQTIEAIDKYNLGSLREILSELRHGNRKDTKA